MTPVRHHTNPWYAAYRVASRVNGWTDGLQGWLFRQHVRHEARRRVA